MWLGNESWKHCFRLPGESRSTLDLSVGFRRGPPLAISSPSSLHAILGSISLSFRQHGLCLSCVASLPYPDHYTRIIPDGPTTPTPAAQSSTVDIPKDVKDALRKFRFARRSSGNAAIVIKINKQKLVMEEVKQFDDISLEDLGEGASSLPFSCGHRARSPVFHAAHSPQNSPRTRPDTYCCRTRSTMTRTSPSC